MNNLAIDNHNIISSEKAIRMLETNVKNLIASPELASVLPPVLFRGAPGVGKSTIVREVAKNLNVGFIDVRLAQLERVDVCGLPSVENGVTKWNVPDMMPIDQNSKGILFFDELTSAPADVQVAAYSLVLDRKIPNSNYRLPDGWYIVAAGNRANDRAVVKTLSSALANRFLHAEIEANAEDWVVWAMKHDIHPSVTGFIQYRPQYLFSMDKQNLEQGWPSPRSWERVSTMLRLYSDDPDMLQIAVFGLIGPAVGVEFMAFYNISKQFDNVLDVLTDPKTKVNIPKRSDERYAYVSAVVYHLWNGENEKEHVRRVDGFYRVARELTNDFATLLVKAAMCGNSKVAPIEAVKYIMSNKQYKETAAKFSAAMKAASANNI